MAKRDLAHLSRLEVIAALPAEHGGPIVMLPWMLDLLTALDDPEKLLLLLCLIRQSGKSQMAFGASVSELFRPNSFTLYMSASSDQAEMVYTRKLRGPLQTLLAAMDVPASAVRFTKRGVSIPALNSQLEIVAPNEFTAPGRSPTLLVFDEPRDIPDETYAATVPSIIGGGTQGKVLIVGTPGRPSGFFFELVTHPPPEAWLYRSAENANPHASKSVLGFLRRHLSLLMPAAARRELEGEFAESGDEFVSAALIDSAVDDGLGELPSHAGPAYAFCDLGRKRDLTSLVTVVVVPARVAEAADHAVAASVQTWSPKDSPTGEVNFADVRAAMLRLPQRFPDLRRVLVDEGAEAGSILPWAKAQPTLATRIEGFTGSVAANMDLWGSLLARLNAGTLSLPRHERLVAELKGLRREEFMFGSRFRVVDASRKFHRDVSLALAGAVLAAGTTVRCPHCDDVECQWPQAPFGLLNSPHMDRWFAAHPPDPTDLAAVEERAERDAGRAARAEQQIVELMTLLRVALQASQHDEAAGRMAQVDALIAGAPVTARERLTAVVHEIAEGTYVGS